MKTGLSPSLRPCSHIFSLPHALLALSMSTMNSCTKRALSRCQHLDTAQTNLQNCEIGSSIYKVSSLWYPVIATRNRQRQQRRDFPAKRVVSDRQFRMPLLFLCILKLTFLCVAEQVIRTQLNLKKKKTMVLQSRILCLNASSYIFTVSAQTLV